MLYIGIDPGAKGGVAWIDGGEGDYWAMSMPVTEADIWDLIRSLPGKVRLSSCRAWIERVHAMPKQGVSSTFAFGRSFGGLTMALTAAEIPFDFVSPSKWQRAMGCLSGGNKNVTKAAAQRLFPSIRITHSIADALLIAEYGRRFLRH